MKKKTAQLPDAASHPQVQRTRQALREGLLSLLKDKPLDQVTHQELASRAKVGYASFFRHYSSKEVLLREIVQEHVTRLLAATVPVVDDKDTHAGCLVLCRHIDQNRDVWSTLVRAAPEMLREELIGLTLQKRPRKNRDQKWVAVELGTRVGVASMLEIVRWWMDDPQSLTVQQAAEVLNRMVVAPALKAS
ncbi:TetR/AcrR family transcriptional regulator [Solimonas sp. K1W22B-7]|uniref:TetR/AcrR family transcriptional regulator n=1 Tax=Solimonas sp. K1W22B-7 TaxID=2303331 RepID=UPI000E334344|nr:TetR/AcrR family transcriptional regulator [Solimonas sp. K1W22B-7]AXQ30493.1 TetR/AcrR family transcriptional regulator [Solimonas sp. K1W22B-7]